MINLREIELTVGQSIVEELDGATLTFDSLPQAVTVPCTFTPIKKTMQIPNMGGGFSSLTSIGIVLFRAALLSGFADDAIMQKGLHCILTPKPGSEPLKLQLWTGGLMLGSALYDFMLVDENYKA